MPSRAKTLSAAAAVLAVGLLAGCVPGYLEPPPDPRVTVTGTPAPSGARSLAELRADNRSRDVADRFPARPTVLDDPSGTASSELFFSSSVTVIVAAAADAPQLRAASLAVFTHAPVLTYTPETHTDVVNEITRLGASRVLTVGQVGLAAAVGETTVIRDPGTLSALGELTAHRFTEVVVADPEDMVQAVANLDGVTPVALTAGWEEMERGPAADLPAFPISSRRDAQQGPLVVATPASQIAAVANARSFGAEVRVVPEANPRATERGLAAMVGMADRPLIALGEEFVSGPALSRAIREAEAAAEEAL